MLTDVAKAVQTQARQMTDQLEELHEGLLALMGLLGEGQNDTMGQCARTLVVLEAVQLKFSGDDDKREGIAGEIRQIVNWVAQGPLPGTAEEIVRESVDELREGLGKGGSMTMETPGHEPVTLHGK